MPAAKIAGSAADSILFQPMKVGNQLVSNRIVLAPLTRFRATRSHVPLVPLVPTYYAQRGSYPGTLLTTEATFISPRAAGYPHPPGIWSDEQVAAWKAVTSAVHASGSKIFLQLWALGRVAVPAILEEEAEAAGQSRDAWPVVGASPIPYEEGKPVPQELSEDEITQFIKDYAQAAKRAVHDAGFDGVEIHGANGYLIDQFIQDVSNQRTDRYGGSIENRSRFALEVTKAVTEAVGSDRTGIRLSPWGTFQGMRMKEPLPQFSHVVTGLKELKLAYIHIVEPVIAGNTEREIEQGESNEPFVQIWGRTSPVLLAGGMQPGDAVEIAERYRDVADVGVVYGRHFIANPDLVYRIKHDIPVNKYNRDTFYLTMNPKGYIDYPFSDEWVQETESKQKAVVASL